MEIKFEGNYPDETRWTVILAGFLKYLSLKYGYTIDEYNLMYSNWSMKIDRLAPLVDERNAVATTLFKFYIDGEMREREQADKYREEAKAAHKALIEDLK